MKLIDRALGSFRTWVDGHAAASGNPDDGRRFAAFFTEYADRCHTEREELVLPHPLVTQAELSAERGPVRALTLEHAEMAAWMHEMTPLLECRPQSADERVHLLALATRYSQTLWRHIDAENSVLFPESIDRLFRCGVREPEDRSTSAAEAISREGILELLQRYPPLEDPQLVRGDGCYMCRAMGETCGGLEAEW
ncbi:MAG TPA: hemerythrin domain-containing protein [Burkholderiaceae bacterium]|nr:hemerythrin domain-containing protein [Burkholderiaceae bacterium]